MVGSEGEGSGSVTSPPRTGVSVTVLVTMKKNRKKTPRSKETA